MKVLWITNTIFPELAKVLGNDPPVVGGWMYGLANDLTKSGIKLSVATAGPLLNDFHDSIEGVEYFLLKGQKSILEYDSTLEDKWKGIVEIVNPDIVHIHGTEYAHGLALVKACLNLNYLMSIQGLVGECSVHYTAGIPKKEILRNKTFRDYLRNDGILEAKDKFYQRSIKVEKEYLISVNHILHRSQWDGNYARTLNEHANYYCCNDSLRDAFYISEKWNIQNKKDYSIFLSQAGYPLKGLHKILEALPFLVDQFPTLKVRIAGNNIIKVNTFKDKLRLGGYGKYLRSLIKKNKLEKYIEFTGPLDEQEMVYEYLNAHIVVSSSSIDNVPNSILEAQFLGVPVIASQVGGVPEMIVHGETGMLYPFDAVEILAEYIKDLFSDDDKALKLSKNGINLGVKRQDRTTNLEKVLEVYQNMLQAKTVNNDA